MKTPNQFLPLLKLMLGFYRYGPLPILIYIVACTVIFFLSSIYFPIGWIESRSRPEMWAGQDILGFSLMWMLLMVIATPLPAQVLAGITSMEFPFTRAIDRGLWLRAERVAAIIIALGPLMLNLLLSPWAPKLAFDPAAAGSPGVAAQQRYLEIFPNSHLVAGDATKSAQLIIDHGTEMFAGWTLWFGMTCIFLVAAYFTTTFRLWQNTRWHHSKSKLRPWLDILMFAGPAYSVIPLFILCGVFRFNLFEESFLLFAAHPALMIAALAVLIIIVQPLSERNIKKFEFL